MKKILLHLVVQVVLQLALKLWREGLPTGQRIVNSTTPAMTACTMDTILVLRVTYMEDIEMKLQTDIFK